MTNGASAQCLRWRSVIAALVACAECWVPARRHRERVCRVAGSAFGFSGSRRNWSLVEANPSAALARSGALGRACGCERIAESYYGNAVGACPRLLGSASMVRQKLSQALYRVSDDLLCSWPDKQCSAGLVVDRRKGRKHEALTGLPGGLVHEGWIRVGVASLRRSCPSNSSGLMWSPEAIQCYRPSGAAAIF